MLTSMTHLELVPPLVEANKSVDLFKKDRQILRSSFSPSNGSLVIYVTEANAVGKARKESDLPIYFTTVSAPPSAERRVFITDTSLIFSAFRHFMRTTGLQDPEWIQREQSLSVIRKLALDYANFIKECWIHASKVSEKDLQFPDEHYGRLFTCFSLFIALYLPEVTEDNSPVGEDLLEWLNVHFIEPSTEEGDHLSSLERPWEDDTFWPYLTRATLRGLLKSSSFFLDILAMHPSPDLQDLSQELIPLLETRPRRSNYVSDREFTNASRRWKDRVRTLRIEMDKVPEDNREDEYGNWWNRLSGIICILEGREDQVLRACEELGADWKEYAVAWTVFVDDRVRRSDLLGVMDRVFDDMPPDPTDLEDTIHSAMFCAQFDNILEYSARLDPWLSVHLADLMEALSLLSVDPVGSGQSLRDEYVLEYAEYLRGDPGLWRITVEYLCSCGPLGEIRADEVITRVPLRLNEASISAGEITGVLKEVNETCREYRREEARRAVCRIAAQTFVQAKRFELAMSYSAAGEDWTGIARIVDQLLDEFIIHGPDAFVVLMKNIAELLPSIRSAPGVPGIFIQRLVFAIRLAELQERRQEEDWQDCAWSLTSMFHDTIAPKSWWAMLLIEAVELLQHPQLLFSYNGACNLLRALDEITIRTEQGSGADYLSILSKALKQVDEREALKKLQPVRLSLARYLARCSLHDDP